MRPGKFFLGLLLATLVWTAWYGSKRGFTRSVREAVFAEFRQHGVEITFKKLTLDPFRGLVARDVTLFDAADRRQVLAQIDQAVLSVDLSRFARGRRLLTALELRDARLSLPIGSPESGTTPLQVEQLRARLFFQNKQVRVEQAEARVIGFRLRAKGWLTNPDAFEVNPTENSGRWAALARNLVEELQKVVRKGDSPLIRLEFSGDMATPESMVASVWIDDAEDLVIRGCPISSLQFSAQWRNQCLELHQLTLEDQGGQMRGTGRWDSVTGSLDFQLESTLDPLKSAQAFGMGQWLEGIHFHERPSLQLQLRRSAHTEGTPRWTASLHTGRFQKGEATFDRLQGYASCQSDRWSIRDLELRHPTGTLHANAISNPEGLKLHFSSTLAPQLLQSLIPKPYVLLPDWVESNAPAQLSFQLHCKGPFPNHLQGKGSLHLGKTRLPGAFSENPPTKPPFPRTGLTLDALDATFLAEQGVLSTSDLHGSGSGLVLHAQGSIHLPKAQLRFDADFQPAAPSVSPGSPLSEKLHLIFEGNCSNPKWKNAPATPPPGSAER
jgi:hypothetical protein